MFSSDNKIIEHCHQFPSRVLRFELTKLPCIYLLDNNGKIILSKIKGALTSFWVICKIIALLIQNYLLHLLAKFLSWKTNRTWAISNFLRLLKTGNYFWGFVVCDVDERHQRLIYIHIIENRLDFGWLKTTKILW